MNLALVFAILSLALCVVLFIYFRWYIQIQWKSAAKDLLEEYRTEVQGLIADINLATDRDSQLVEERIKTLKKLLEDTDKRISVFIKELDHRRSGEVIYAKLGRGFHSTPAVEAAAAPKAPAPKTDASVPAAPEIPQTAGAGHGGNKPKIDSTPAGNKRSGPVKTPVEKQSLRLRIAELAIQGYDAARIASELKISVSEVELALNLLAADIK